MASGCTTTPKEVVVTELDVGGSGITTKYVSVPSDAKIRVEISNVQHRIIHILNQPNDSLIWTDYRRTG